MSPSPYIFHHFAYYSLEVAILPTYIISSCKYVNRNNKGPLNVSSFMFSKDELNVPEMMDINPGIEILWLFPLIYIIQNMYLYQNYIML